LNPERWGSPLVQEQYLEEKACDMRQSNDDDKTSLLIDIALPGDINVNTKETKKLGKSKILEIEVSRMWKVRTKIVPVITQEFGRNKKRSYQNLQLLPSHLPTIELEKITLISTANIIFKTLG